MSIEHCLNFITDIVTENVLSYLDVDSLKSGELVCKRWYDIISVGRKWKTLFEHKVETDPVWCDLVERRDLIQSSTDSTNPPYSFYRSSFLKVSSDIKRLEKNWRNGEYILKETKYTPGNKITDYDALQFDNHKIVCAGLTSEYEIDILDFNSLECTKTLIGHEAPVLCLQFDDKMIISGSMFDGTVCVWDIVTGDLLNTLNHHTEGVNNLRFKIGILVTCSDVSA